MVTRNEIRGGWDRWSLKAISALSFTEMTFCKLDSCFFGIPDFFPQRDKHLGKDTMNKKKVTIRKNFMKFHTGVY